MSAAHPDTSSDAAPSSPTTSSFYVRPTPPGHRAHKSSSSTRRRPPSTASSSSPTKSSLRTRTIENARLARASTHKARDLGADGDAPSGFEPGAADRWEFGGPNSRGEWEVYSEEEERMLARRAERDARRWQDEVRELADDAASVDEEEDDPTDDDGSLLDWDELDGVADYRLWTPSIALPPPSDPPSSLSQLGDIDMDGASSPFSATPRPDLATTVAHHFEAALLAAPCPSCRAIQVLGVHASYFRCSRCDWRVEQTAVQAIEHEWITHALATTAPASHLPLLCWTPYTGTLVLCDSCEEQFAA